MRATPDSGIVHTGPAAAPPGPRSPRTPMPRYEQLDNIRHRDLCVATGFGAHFGDNMAMVPVVPAEFRQLQREYTIFFRKDPVGGFQSVALLGFEPRTPFREGLEAFAKWLREERRIA